VQTLPRVRREPLVQRAAVERADFRVVSVVQVGAVQLADSVCLARVEARVRLAQLVSSERQDPAARWEVQEAAAPMVLAERRER
jgi:hypothetical protein